MVKITEKLILNLAQVLYMEKTRHDDRPCVAIYFAGNDWPLRIYANRNEGYAELCTFIDEQQTLLHD